MKPYNEPNDLAGRHGSNDLGMDYRMGPQASQASPSNLNRNDLRQKMIKRKNLSELLGSQGGASKGKQASGNGSAKNQPPNLSNPGAQRSPS